MPGFVLCHWRVRSLVLNCLTFSIREQSERLQSFQSFWEREARLTLMKNTPDEPANDKTFIRNWSFYLETKGEILHSMQFKRCIYDNLWFVRSLDTEACWLTRVEILQIWVHDNDIGKSTGCPKSEKMINDIGSQRWYWPTHAASTKVYSSTNQTTWIISNKWLYLTKKQHVSAPNMTWRSKTLS